MAAFLLALAGAIYCLLGTLHGLLTLRDVVTPRAFTPSDDAVRLAMQGTQVRFNRRLNLWQAWLGFNLSHSLGAIILGVSLLVLAWHFPLFAASWFLQAAVLAAALSFLAIAVGFWFYGPIIGTSVALALIVAALRLA